MLTEREKQASTLLIAQKTGLIKRHRYTTVQRWNRDRYSTSVNLVAWGVKFPAQCPLLTPRSYAYVSELQLHLFLY